VADRLPTENTEMSKIQIILLIVVGVLAFFYPFFKKLDFEKKNKPNKKQNSRQKTNKTRTRSIPIIILIIIGVFLFINVRLYTRTKNLKTLGQTTLARITKYEPGGFKKSGTLEFEFFANGKTYKIDQGAPTREKGYLLVNHYFPVIYQYDDPDNC